MTELAGPINEFTAFIDISEDEQISELEQYFSDKSVSITTDEDESQVTRIEHIIEASRIIFEKPEVTSQEQESLMYSIVSLFHVLPQQDTAKFLDNLCLAVLSGTTPTNVKQRMRLLNLLICQLDIKNVMSSVIFWRKLELGIKFELGSQMDIDLSLLKSWMDSWSFSIEDKQKMWKLVLQLYKPTTKRSLACLVLTELVSTYTSPSDDVHQLVIELVVMAINDPDRYIFNELLELEIVKSFKSEKIYELLQQFVTGKYTTFLQFCQENDGYLETLGLDKSACLHKIQVLTLLSLAEDNSEIPFSVISSELQLDMNLFEQLIIDAIRCKLINARIDHVNQKLIIINCFRRTFGTNEWNLIRDCLTSWKQSISSFRSNLKSIKSQNIAQ